MAMTTRKLIVLTVAIPAVLVAAATAVGRGSHDLIVTLGATFRF